MAARKLHVHNDLILRRNKYYTFIRTYGGIVTKLLIYYSASGSFLHNLRVFVTPIFQIFVWRSGFRMSVFPFTVPTWLPRRRNDGYVLQAGGRGFSATGKRCHHDLVFLVLFPGAVFFVQMSEHI